MDKKDKSMKKSKNKSNNSNSRKRDIDKSRGVPTYRSVYTGDTKRSIDRTGRRTITNRNLDFRQDKKSSSNKNVRNIDSYKQKNKNTTNRSNQYNVKGNNGEKRTYQRDKYQNVYYTSNNRYSGRYSDGKYSRSKEINTKRIYRAKRKSNRNISLISKIFFMAMFTIIVGYLGFSVSKSLNKKPIDYEQVEYGKIEASKPIKGIIIRDEVVVKASKAGVVNFNVSENERVKKGELIASIKNEEAIKIEEKDVEAINEKILQLQEQRNELSLFYEDVKKIDSQIQKTLDNAIQDLTSGNIPKMYKLKDNIDKKINIRNQMLLSENMGSVQELSNQKFMKEQKINENVENLLAIDTGILSYYIDGLEATLNIKNKDTLTKEQTLMNVEEKENYKLNVVQDDPIFKIVKDNMFYIASYIPTDNISTWKAGDTRRIYVNDDGKLTTLEVVIDKIVPNEKESYVVMKTNKDTLDYIDKRNIVFEISKPKEGFKIFTKAISEEELLKVPSNYIVESNVTKKTKTGETTLVPIKESGQDEAEGVTYVTITPGLIDVGDVILEPKTKQERVLNEIFTKKGIYIVNSGIYTFRSINTENSVQDDQFIILDPSKNTNIKLYDRYAPDLSAVKGDETLKNDEK